MRIGRFLKSKSLGRNRVILVVLPSSVNQDQIQMKNSLLFALLSVVAALSATSLHAEILLTFDDLTPGSTSGNQYVSEGISFSYGELTGSVAVGSLLTFSNLTDGLEIVAGGFAISGTNAASTFNGLDDNLMSFSSPVSRLSLVTDDQLGESTADVVRLIALEATNNPFTFRVIDFAERLDDTTSLLENTMTLELNVNFSFAAFQRTTEPEAFDNLQFTSVPEPTCVLMLCVSISYLCVAKRGRTRR